MPRQNGCPWLPRTTSICFRSRLPTCRRFACVAYLFSPRKRVHVDCNTRIATSQLNSDYFEKFAMATTAPPMSFSASTSSFRASQSQNGPVSYSDSPLTQLPTVDFKFEDLRKRMAEFTVKFDAFIEQGRKRVLQERNEFRARLGEISGT